MAGKLFWKILGEKILIFHFVNLKQFLNRGKMVIKNLKRVEIKMTKKKVELKKGIMKRALEINFLLHE